MVGWGRRPEVAYFRIFYRGSLYWYTLFWLCRLSDIRRRHMNDCTSNKTVGWCRDGFYHRCAPISTSPTRRPGDRLARPWSWRLCRDAGINVNKHRKSPPFASRLPQTNRQARVYEARPLPDPSRLARHDTSPRWGKGVSTTAIFRVAPFGRWRYDRDTLPPTCLRE